MLKTLDPHSSFFDPRSYRQLRERQQGSYYGLGIQIQPIDGDITVMSVFENSPAYKKGLRRGDVIARIKSTNTKEDEAKGWQDAKGWTADQAVAQLKGPKGTTVGISLRRRGYDGLDRSRDRARRRQHHDRARRVHDRQGDRLHQAGGFLRDVERRSRQGAEGSRRQGHEAADFRPARQSRRAARPGHSISNRFLPKGELIAYTKGRTPTSNEEYRATEESDYIHQPLVVLVNRNSASASEIVSGALQDHDRALIVGETTFGKALVQSVYTIGSRTAGAGLALTTGRYYTPSGRMIQRPWDGSFDEYLTYSLRDQTAERSHDSAELRYTDAKRKVYGGGGIEPDKFLAGPVEGFNPDAVRPHVVGPRRSSRTSPISSRRRATRG